jgi:hypothetical protein
MSSDSEKTKIEKAVKGIRWSWKKIIGILGGVSLLFSIYASIPKVVVAPGLIISPHNPFNTSFTITNNGFLPVKELGFEYFFKEMKIFNVKFRGGTFRPKNNFIPKLKAGETTTIFINENIIPKGIPTSAEILIKLKFRLYLIPVKFKDQYRFKTVKNNEGYSEWIQLYSST